MVTGGAQGIGQAICASFAAEGIDVVVADLNRAGAEETANDVESRGARALAIELDVASEDSVINAFSLITTEFSHVDIVVNNAGICELTPILDLDVRSWDRMMGVNLRGTFMMSREAFRIMKEQRSGKIVNMASLAAKIGGAAAGAHYSASKAGVICFTKSLALQAAPYRINVNAVAPGPIDTDLTAAWPGETNESFAARIPWKEFGDRQDVADVVVFLASEKARYITGEIIDVNGGFLMD